MKSDAIEPLLAQVKWEEVVWPSGGSDPIPTHRGEFCFHGIQIRVYKLSDGRTVVHADDYHYLAGTVDITTAEGK